MEGANRTIIRNVALVGAFWTGVFFLVSSANAESIYDNQGAMKTVTVAPGMNPGTVPPAEVKVDAGSPQAESGNANSGGVQVQTVTVQNGADAKADSNSNSNAGAYNSVDSINKTRSDTEQTHNALLLQQLELQRLKAEQSRLTEIQEFGNNINKPSCEGPSCAIPPPPAAAPIAAPAAPCGVGPCMPAGAASAPLIENTVVSSTGNKSTSIEVEEEKSSSNFFKDTKWGLSPIVGMRWANAPTGFFHAKVNNQYLIGGALSAEINRWVSAEASFMYGKDKLQGWDQSFSWWHESYRSSYEIALGAKVGPRFDSIRPFVALGLGSLIQKYDNTNASPRGENTTYNVEGNIGAGVDFQVAKNFSVGARGDYQGVMGGSNKFLSRTYGDDAGRFRLGATGTVSF